MTEQELIDIVREAIRTAGFMSAVKLAGVIIERAVNFKINKLVVDWPIFVEGILKKIPCKDILTVEYTNALTQDYRRKDLYYFLPVTN